MGERGISDADSKIQKNKFISILDHFLRPYNNSGQIGVGRGVRP